MKKIFWQFIVLGTTCLCLLPAQEKKSSRGFLGGLLGARDKAPEAAKAAPTVKTVVIDDKAMARTEPVADLASPEIVTNTPNMKVSDLVYSFSKEEHQHFVNALGRKQGLELQARVILDLLREKDQELTQLNLGLKQFGIDPEKNYNYDPEIRTLSLIPTSATNTAEAASSAPKVVLKDEQHPVFIRTVTAKNLTTTAISSLKLLALEKQQEIRSVNDALKSSYRVDSDKTYFFDDQKRTLYLVEASP